MAGAARPHQPSRVLGDDEARHGGRAQAETLAGGGGGGFGFAAYNNAYLLWAVPHGIVTVSLVTALLPRMSGAAADGDLAGVRRDVSYGLRASAAAVVPRPARCSRSRCR